MLHVRTAICGLSLVIMLALALSGCGSTQNSGGQSSSSSPDEKPISLSLPTGTPQLPLGLAALQPHFTEQDVKDYVTMHPVPRNLSQTPIDVVSIQFMRVDEANKLLDDDLGLPDDRQVCYVTLKGTFTFPGPDQTVGTYQQAVEMFDVDTGNLLLVGSL